MKIKDVRKMTNEELNAKILHFKKELFDTKLQLELSKTKNTSRVRKIRIIIAQMKTVLNERKLSHNVVVENNPQESKTLVEEQKSIQNNPLEKDQVEAPKVETEQAEAQEVATEAVQVEAEKTETTEVETEQVENEEKNKESDTQK
ncbi:MAG: 50S ribosomal protein L29 ['Conium maculatum' witches'-broom phytoplasma]|nr:50S ribosomal protein L29 ['Conium maculatum' witches'-broom phytoplasma]